jgi:enoyl-CoA hydratase/carnithine racemase
MSFQKLLARILVFGLPTFSAITGHAFAGGLIFALAHDHRVMTRNINKADTFKLCIPLAINGYPLVEGIRLLVTSKITDANTTRDVILFARIFTATEAHSRGFVDDLIPFGDQSTMIASASKIASKVASRKFEFAVLNKLKQQLYKHVIEAISQTNANSQSNDAFRSKI